MPFRQRATVDGSYASAYSIPITTGSFVTPALTVQIPKAGKWLVFAKVVVNGGGVRIDSKLSIGGGGGDLDFSSATIDSSGFATIALQTAWDFQTPGSVDLYLLTFNNTPAEAANIKMSAIRVDNLTSGTLP